ncbi:hypothetical protein [Cedecea colo]|uniref:CdiI C-terminal domain-containing protein n=1 Tax=Cedecea colo TaxID=2552946 RepID=A0ABX0VH09_9ENTR|nr:hypothetical protein [Cedecea colo]NIY46266.1 hypothetical protein [Cedecea colo]
MEYQTILCELALFFKKGIYGKNNATLVVSMYSPKDANFLFSWVLYFRQEDVIVQNKMIFLDEINNFSIDKINEYTSEYEAYSEGEKVSEWYTTIDEVKEYMSYLESKIS